MEICRKLLFSVKMYDSQAPRYVCKLLEFHSSKHKIISYKHAPSSTHQKTVFDAISSAFFGPVEFGCHRFNLNEFFIKSVENDHSC